MTSRIKSLLIFFYFSQLVWITTSFFAFGLFVGSNKLTLLPLIICMIGYFSMSTSFLVLLRSFLFALDDINEDRRYLKEAAEDIKNIDEEERRLLLRDIDNLKPLSPYGLFSVERSTLTSMMSTSITYLIILIQFKQSGY